MLALLYPNEGSVMRKRINIDHTQPSNRSKDWRETRGVAETRAGIISAPQNANRPAPRIGRAVTINHSSG
jgi:hypothetical protein